MSVRNAARDVGRIERTKLERRLEKLIDLHFSPNAGKTSQPPVNRRASSFFDFDMSELKNVDPSGLWKGMLQSQVSSKSDIRGMVGLFRLPPIHNPIFSYATLLAAEQRITPWQDDASVSKCPLCS
jgi:rabenosyn-5